MAEDTRRRGLADMKVRADTPDEKRVPDVGDEFIVTSVKRKHIWWIIELERKENDGHGDQTKKV